MTLDRDDLSRRRKAALEALGWGSARSGVAGFAPGAVSIPGVMLNDLATYRAIYKAYFDRRPTDEDIKSILKKRGLTALILLKSVSTARGLAQALNPVPNPVTTEFAVALCASSTATGAALFILGCDHIYRNGSF
ncbi:hypothetical protein [Couchioplanes azureus]|uniref:hypothetical protein n=1 Tax=Couchioplanes caeruleus TaxID=56438 RepID=UPI0016714820|nr:hypothetical protein [Couchioplanes caeruleus]GGQ85272.1 hypothetical protein GCM10010166_64450 [Couchioplanes caeruleus subsp. azureus]